MRFSSYSSSSVRNLSCYFSSLPLLLHQYSALLPSFCMDGQDSLSLCFVVFCPHILSWYILSTCLLQCCLLLLNSFSLLLILLVPRIWSGKNFLCPDFRASQFPPPRAICISLICNNVVRIILIIFSLFKWEMFTWQKQFMYYLSAPYFTSVYAVDLASVYYFVYRHCR